MAQAVTQKMVADAGRSNQIRVDSAGTHANHSGEWPDARAEAALARRGYSATRAKSRKVTPRDFQNFDLIVAMDSNNLAELRRLCPPEHLTKLSLFMDYANGLSGCDVPDPYYGNAQGFEKVLDLCEAGATGLIKQIFQRDD